MSHVKHLRERRYKPLKSMYDFMGNVLFVAYGPALNIIILPRSRTHESHPVSLQIPSVYLS